MSLVKGYSSSEEEDEQVKDKSFKVGNAFITRESYDDATFHINNEAFKRAVESRIPNKKKTKRHKGNFEDASYLGPWAKFKDSSDEEQEVPAILDASVVIDQNKREDINDQEPDSEEETEETTRFYGDKEFDYQGRTYMYIPNEIKRKESPKECFLPKKQIKELKGHIKGVTKLEYFPNTNHLLLSSGNDSKIYLWSLINFKLLRGYFGHSKPIRDITFNNDGSKFLSSSYDKTVKLWDTETGEILKTFKLNSICNCIKFNPNNNDEFLIGLMNNKIEHHSISANEILQTYNHHLGSVNDLLFLNDGTKFISTSEDKTIRVWEININIPIKLISDPTLHSMPILRLHPTEEYFIAQSMDNSILVFSTKDRFKTNKKKVFKGHDCAGYGISIDISPDGKYVISGDSNGNLVIWDWKSCNLIKKFKIDDKVISQVNWNKKESSKIAIAGLSGRIYYYD